MTEDEDNWTEIQKQFFGRWLEAVDSTVTYRFLSVPQATFEWMCVMVDAAIHIPEWGKAFADAARTGPKDIAALEEIAALFPVATEAPTLQEWARQAMSYSNPASEALRATESATEEVSHD